jgi:hypothetical protein
MADEFNVEFNRRDGVIKISGGDKDWIAEQLGLLVPALGEAPIETADRSGDRDPENGVSQDAEPRDSARDGNGDSAARPRRARASGRATEDTELKDMLTKEVKDKLSQYRAERETQWQKNQSYQPAIIATFLRDELGILSIGPNQLYTVYLAMGWPGPSNYRSQLSNAQTRNRHFGAASEGKFTLSHAGETFGRHGSKESPADPRS